MRAVQLFVDESVVKAGRGRVRGYTRVKYPRRTRPVNGSQAHRAWFTRRVKVAARQLKIAKLAASFANRHYLGVRGGIVRGGNAVRAFRDDAAVFCDYRGEGAAAPCADVLHWQRDRAAPEPLPHLACSRFKGSLPPAN